MKNFGQILIFILFSYWSVNLLFHDMPWIMIDNANLLFHEAGHFLFIPLGEFMSFLGGTILQIALPAGFFTYFFLRKQYFSSLVVLFWIGDNLINIGNYMSDAIPMSIPLLIDGSTHDWNWIFTQLHILSFSPAIGGFVHFIGGTCIVVSLFMILITIIRNFFVKSI